MRNGISILAIVVGGLAGSSVAAAQSAGPEVAASTATQNSSANVPEAKASQDGGLDEIVVTAQRRSERVQDVPISVTTLSTRQLESAGVAKTDALVQVTPGLVINRQIYGATPYIRGVGSQSVSPGVESPVATYVDGVYYASAVGNIFSFNNVRQVEVLKGPQGTLFGRNATGGLINVTTRDPSSAPALEGSIGYGNYRTLQGSLYATGGSDHLAADLAIYAIHQADGFGRSRITGADVNREREFAVRSKILWTPSPDDRVTLSGDFSRDRTDAGVVLGVVPGGVALDGSTYDGRPWDARANYPDTVRIDHFGGSLKYEHDFGFANFASTTAYRKLNGFLSLDQDGTPLPVADVNLTERTRTFQQEAILVGHSTDFDWTAGLFYFWSSAGYFPLMVKSAIIPPLNFDTNSRQTTRSYAGFAQGTYDLGPQTRITLGLRYTVDRRRFVGTQTGTAGSPLDGVTFASASASARYPKLTYRLAIDHKLAPDTLIYASYNRGFKSGLFSTGSVGNTPVRPETLDAIEGGLKTDLFDRVLRFNLSAFYYKYKDIQLTRIEGGAGVLLNAARGRSYGGEIEATLAPHLPEGSLRLTANLALLNAKYTSFPDGPFFTVNPAGGDIQSSADLSGNRMIRSPEMTLNLGVDYALPMGSGQLEMSANYYRSSRFNWEPDGNLSQPAYGTVNAQVGYAFGADRRYRVRIWGKNLTDKLYYIYALEGVLGNLGNPAPPRTYGAALDFKF